MVKAASQLCHRPSVSRVGLLARQRMGKQVQGPCGHPALRPGGRKPWEEGGGLRPAAWPHLVRAGLKEVCRRPRRQFATRTWSGHLEKARRDAVSSLTRGQGLHPTTPACRPV